MEKGIVEISTKGLETTSLVAALKEWKTQGAPVDSPSDSEDDSDSDSSGPGEDLLEDSPIPVRRHPRGQRSCIQCRARRAVQSGNRGKVTDDNDSLSDLEDKCPYPRTSTSARKGHLRTGRQSKSCRGEIQPSGVVLLPKQD